jgi:hypothetical protein
LEPRNKQLPWNDPCVYGYWLAQTFYYVSHSTRLLAAAASRFGCDDHGTALHWRFAAHMGEEKRHELLCLHDLKQLNLTLDRFPERHSTRMFYEPQYFKVEHQDPIVLFGYIFPLEMLSLCEAGRGMLTITEGAFGRQATTFLRVHIDDDPDHIEKAYQALEGANSAQLKLIEQNLRQTVFAYDAMLRDVREGSVEKA